MKTLENLDELNGLIGQKIGVSDWVTMDQARIDMFAEATGDHQWIHVDPDRARQELPTKTTIAHGYLTLSLLPMLTTQILKVENVSMGINYGANKIRFINMVPAGARVRARQTLKDVTIRPDGARQLVNEIVMEVEGLDRPAMIAETISLFYP